MSEKLRLCQHLETAANNASERGSKAVAKDMLEQIAELLKEIGDARNDLAEFRQLAKNTPVASTPITCEVSRLLFKLLLNHWPTLTYQESLCQPLPMMVNYTHG